MRTIYKVLGFACIGYALWILLSQVYVGIYDRGYWQGRLEGEAYQKSRCYSAHRECLAEQITERERVETILAERKYRRMK